MNNKDEIESEEIEINAFYNLMALTNSNEMTDYIALLKESFKDYFAFISRQYNTLNESYYNFTKSKIENKINKNPLYIVESMLKELIQIQMKNLESIVNKIDIIDTIAAKLKKFQELLEKVSSKFINFSKSSFNGIDYKQIATLSSSLTKEMNEFEKKIIDQYINEKYNEHLLENDKNRTIDDIIKDVKYFENSLINYVKDHNVIYFNELKKSDDSIQNGFKEIKNCLIELISNQKDANKNSINELDNLENTIKLKKMSEIIKSEDENTIFSKSDFCLDEKEVFKNIYKINILKNNRIQLLMEKDEDEKKEENTKKEKVNKFKRNNRILDDRDIYEIILRLYSYDLLTLDKSQYNIDSENAKLEAVDLSTEILKYNKDDENTQMQFNEKYDEIIKSINEKILNNTNNIKSFFITFNNYRANGKTKIFDKFYDLIIYIYTKVEDGFLNKRDKTIVDIMLILSQTYFKEIKNKKIYILDGIKTHELYKKIDFWIEVIIKKIEEDFKLYKKMTSKKDINPEKKEDSITNKLITFINLMKEFELSKDNISDIVNVVINKHQISQKGKDIILQLINEN